MNRNLPAGAFLKDRSVPSVISKHQKRRAAEQALQEAYEVVNVRDGNRCRCTGLPLSPTAIETKHRREHHHLKGRNVKPEWVTDPDRIVLVSKTVHDLINQGWMVVEGTDATKTIRFHYAEHVKPDQKIVKIQSRRWSQQE